jgi:hypothetical protein
VHGDKYTKANRRYVVCSGWANTRMKHKLFMAYGCACRQKGAKTLMKRLERRKSKLRVLWGGGEWEVLSYPDGSVLASGLGQRKAVGNSR